jgi:hypothetical protein
MDRRTFLTEAAVLAALSGVTIRITGCSEDSSPTGGGGNPDVVQGVVGTNHGHTVEISRTVINAGQAVTLQLTTGDGHIHSVSLTAQQVADIGQGLRVQENSTEDGAFPHRHVVTFN